MITQHYSFVCDLCGLEHGHTEPLTIARSEHPPAPNLPQNWRLVDGGPNGYELLVCPKHDVRVDDQVVTPGIPARQRLAALK